MPNWCNNVLIITLDNDLADELNDAALDGNLLNFMRPQPENLYRGPLGDEERAKCKAEGIPNWYDWSVSHWGTKWDVDQNGIHIDELDADEEFTTLRLAFDTAWSPPIEAIAYFYGENQDKIETFKIIFSEIGMMFAGVYGDDAEDHHNLSDCNSVEDMEAKLGSDMMEELGLYEMCEWMFEEEEEEEVSPPSSGM